MATTSSTRSRRRDGAPRTVRVRPGARPLGWLVAAVAVGLTLAYAPAVQADDQETGTITGRVVDSAGQPLSGITVEAHRIVSFTHSSWIEYSGANGTFTIEVPAATGRLTYWLTMGDARPSKVYASRWIGDEDHTHPVAAGETWNVGDVALDRLASISGTVTQPDGTPVKSVWVTATSDDEHAAPTSIRTAADGSYIVRVAPGSTYSLLAYLSGTWESTPLTAAPEEEDQVVTGIDILVTSVACPGLRTALAGAKRANATAQAAKTAAERAAETAQNKAVKAKKKLKKAKKAHKPTKKIVKLKAKAKKAKSDAGAAAAAHTSSAAAAVNAARTLVKAQADVDAKCLPQ